MITSSKINSVTFKDLSSGSYPNKWNTLHRNRKMAGFKVIDYCQKFNKDDTIILQFTSDSATVPVLKSFNPAPVDEINGTLASNYSGDYDRYFFNFQITLGASYYDKKIYFTVEQDGNTLTSEPIYCRDLSEDLAKGVLKYVKYTNLDRNEGDLSDYWIDWSVVNFMFFYVEAVDREVNNTEEIEVLEGAQSKKLISAQNYSGISLKTGGIPDYLSIKLAIVSNLDYFEVNGIQYIKEGETEEDVYGSSTLLQTTINLTEKNTVGLNVDDLGITETDGIMAIKPIRNRQVTTAGIEVTNPEGYMLHSIFIKHASISGADAVVNAGTSVGGDELIDDIQGDMPKADYSSKWKSFSRHYLKDPESSSPVYFTVSGAGAVLDIIVNFDTVTEQS